MDSVLNYEIANEFRSYRQIAEARRSASGSSYYRRLPLRFSVLR